MFRLTRWLVIVAAVGTSAPSLFAQEVIENWPAPRYWTPRAPMTAPSSDGSLAPLEADVIPSPPLPFVAVNPCRIADTRGLGFTGQAGPPAISVGAAIARSVIRDHPRANLDVCALVVVASEA